MSKTYSAGIVTAYGAAKRAGYTGTYEDFCRQQAGYAESAATVEQAKNTAVSAASTATAKAGEAATVATAAQTAKTQTEQAASQALTDIATARSGAISAVHTEGQTQTANARAQARAAAASATTASTKASEASASATSAGQSAANADASATSAANAASAAQAVLESIHEDYSDLSEDVDKLKADLGDVKSTITNGYQSITPLVNGSFNANGSLTVNAKRLREETFIHVKSGDKIIVDAGTLKYVVGAWNGTPSTETSVRNDSAFRENGETIISDFDGYYIIVFAKQNTSENITPSDFDGEIRVYSGETYSNTQRIAETNGRIEEIKSDVSEIENALTVVTSPIYEDIPTSLTIEDGYYGAGGSYHGDTNYKHSQKISVIEGDVITPVSAVSSAYFRFVCAYNGTSAVSSAGASSGTTSYTVPSGIDGVIVSFNNSHQITAVNIKRLTGEETTVYPVAQELGYTNWKGSLSDGTNVKLLSSNVRFNVVWAFTGHVSTMGKVTIGITASDSTFKELCSVDATNIYYRLQNGSITSEAHGLDVSEDLQIRIESDFLINELKKIVICSGGTEFSPIGKPYGTDMNGAPTLISDGATMTDCAFAWIPKDIDKPIWVFGDSWVSMYDTRWTYYMTQAGFVNSWMLNGYAGEKTETALVALKNLMTIRKPDYIVWLLGMNNRDTSSAVSSTWKSVYDELLSICEAYKITPILYTVPNTPTINNNFKNDIVRNSGFRYIDGAAAVGDDGNGNWFTGYEQSASDHNHTSAKGARALFMRILADFPEIASNGL